MIYRLAIFCLMALLASAAPLRADELEQVVAGASAASGGPLTLRGAAERALDEGYEARIARLERGRVDDSLENRRGAFWPQLSVSAQAGYSNRQNDSFTALDEDGKFRKFGLANLGNDPWLSVVFDQVVLDLKRWRELEREELAAEVAAITEREHSERVVYDVVTRYAELLRAGSLAAAAREQYDAAVWLDEQTALLEEAGRALGNERLQAEIEREAARVDMLSADAALDAARSSLWLAMDADARPEAWPGVVPASMPELELTGPAGGGEESLELAMSRAPDVQILDLQRRMQEASVSVKRAARYPSLQLRGGYAHYGINRFDNFKDEAFVFVGMEIPLFDGFQAASAVAGARKAASAARLQLEAALSAKRARIVDLRRRLEIANQRARLGGRRVSASLEAQRLVDLQLKSQRMRIEDAQRARENTRRDRQLLADLQFQRVELWATLQRELGVLAESVTQAGRTAPAASLP